MTIELMLMLIKSTIGISFFMEMIKMRSSDMACPISSR